MTTRSSGNGGNKQGPVAAQPKILSTDKAGSKRHSSAGSQQERVQKSKTTPKTTVPVSANAVTGSRHVSRTGNEQEKEKGRPEMEMETPRPMIQPTRLLQQERYTTVAEQADAVLLGQVNKPELAIFRWTVQSVLFPKVKFITSPAMLDYGHKVTRTILEKIDFKTEGEKQTYWGVYRDRVNRALGDKRGNVNNEMKKSFMSKCCKR